jgi:hypothetical protein
MRNFLSGLATHKLLNDWQRFVSIALIWACTVASAILVAALVKAARVSSTGLDQAVAAINGRQSGQHHDDSARRKSRIHFHGVIVA